MSNDRNIILFQNARELEAEAAEWIARLDGEDATSEDITSFHTWRAQSDSHREAYEKLSRFWKDSDRIEELHDYAAAIDEAEAEARRSRGNHQLSRRFSSLASAAVLLLVVTGVTTYLVNGFQGGGRPSVYETRVGEHKQFRLADGSSIELNTASKVRVVYMRSARRVHLDQGEAFFEVVADERRPFSVYAGERIVTAVGTAFSVRRIHANDIDVLVSEGRVSLASVPLIEAPGSGVDRNRIADERTIVPLLEVTAGQQAVFGEKLHALDHVDREELDRKLMWRSGVLAFAGEPLSEVVAEVSRYGMVRIEIEGEQLRQMPVAGFFHVGDADAMLEGLAALVDIRITRVSPTEVKISRDPER